MDHVPQKRDNSKVVLAIALILIGVFWALKKLGFYIEFQPFFYDNIFFPLQDFFHSWRYIIFSWPMILIVVGAVLLANKRSVGIIVLVIGAIFIIPKLFFLNGITITFLFPLLLIGIGVAMVARLI